MTTEEFLRHIWPSTGLYCVVHSATLSNGRQIKRHKVFQGITGALEYIDLQRQHEDVWFAIHTLKEPFIKDGDAIHWRTHENMKEARAFFLDLDVGDAKNKYSSQKEAVIALHKFCVTIGIPMPMTVSSGNGVHVYWVIDRPLPTLEWKAHALKLRALMTYHNMRFDDSRVDDQSSILRVAGTFNQKNRDNPKPIEVKTRAEVIPTDDFIRMLSDAVIVAGINVNDPPAPRSKKQTSVLGSNIGPDELPPVDILTVAEYCYQVQRFIRLRGRVSEPEWQASLMIAMHLRNGDKLVHRISEGDERYTPEGTDEKVQRLRDSGVGPASCEMLQQRCGAEICAGCVFESEPKINATTGARLGPLAFARRWLKSKEAPPPVVQLPSDIADEPEVIPPPPKPFKRLSNGSIAVSVEADDEKHYDVIILDTDLYPIKRLEHVTNQKENNPKDAYRRAAVIWRAATPKDGEVEFELKAHEINDLRVLSSALAHNHVWVLPDNLKDVQRYMIAYIKELQKTATVEEQHDHFGWGTGLKSFVLSDRVIFENDRIGETRLVGNAASAGYLRKAGALDEQVRLLDFFNNPDSLRMQFLICASIGSPLLALTPQHGALVNAQGPSGTAKTTALYAAASIWGNPDRYIINGREEGSSLKGRYDRSMTLCNLPLCIDEFTDRDTKDIISLAMGATQGVQRLTLTRTGMERAQTDRLKANIAIITSNTSLVRRVGDNLSAGIPASMRIIEIPFPVLERNPEMKAKGDTVLIGLRENHGLIGEHVARFYVQHRSALGEQIAKLSTKIETRADLPTSYRIRTSAAACTIVGCEVARRLGLVGYDPKVLLNWYVSYLIPQMRRETIILEPSSIIADYLSQELPNSLIVAKRTQGSGVFTLREPRGALNVRYDMQTREIVLADTPLDNYCNKRGVDLRELKEQLFDAQIIKNRANVRTRMVLSKGTDLPSSGQVRCVILNMDHPDIAGMVAEDVATPKGGPGVIGGAPALEQDT